MIRHAKSSWANPLQSDFERPLNERGQQDAPIMGKRLRDKRLVPDLIISSTAKRTRQTAKHIAEAIGYKISDIRWEEKLYHCIPSVFDEILYEVKETVQTVFIIAHNPGITEFVNNLSSAFYTGNMPTCGMVGARFEAEGWSGFSMAEKKVFLFDYPKKEHESQ